MTLDEARYRTVVALEREFHAELLAAQSAVADAADCGRSSVEFPLPGRAGHAVALVFHLRGFTVSRGYALDTLDIDWDAPSPPSGGGSNAPAIGHEVARAIEGRFGNNGAAGW